MDDTFLKVVIGVLVLAVAIAASALLIGVINAGSQLLSSAILLTLQILLAFVAIGVAVAISWFLVGGAIATTGRRFAELEERYSEQFERLKAKRPAWIATLLFATEAILILVDKSFQEQKRETLIASFTLLVGFWVANQLLISKERWQRTIGGVLWFLVLLLFPTLIMIHRQLDIAQFLTFLASFDADVRIFFAAAFLTLMSLPMLLLRGGAEVG